MKPTLIEEKNDALVDEDQNVLRYNTWKPIPQVESTPWFFSPY